MYNLTNDYRKDAVKSIRYPSINNTQMIISETQLTLLLSEPSHSPKYLPILYLADEDFRDLNVTAHLQSNTKWLDEAYKKGRTV
jgi:hypothetical protein